LIKDQRAIAFNDSLSLKDKAGSYLALIDRVQPYADAINLADLYATYASLLPSLGEADRMSQYLERGVNAAKNVGDLVTASQILGTLGALHASDEKPDRMRAAWDEGLRLARQAESWQEARILDFYATYYLNRGQFALFRE